MMYDLFADFYEKSSDSQPKYTVLLGSYYPKTIGEMEELGFQEDKNSTPGYLDYVMEVDEEEVTSFIQDGYESETLDIIYSGIEWEKVLISATEVEVIDDDGHYPPRGVMMGDTFVAFGKSNPDETVIFKRGNPYETKGSVPEFHVTVSRVKHLLGVETLTEAIMKLQAMSEEKNWTYEELKDLFFPKESSLITLDDITPAFEMGDYVAFTLKKDFDRRTEIKDYDPVVMYVKRTDEEPDYWFDRAHVAETLAPMSIWEIPEESRKECKDWLDDTFSLRQLLQLLTDYSKVLDYVAENPNSLLPDNAQTKHPIV